jgi:hypothetical protein
MAASCANSVAGFVADIDRFGLTVPRVGPRHGDNSLLCAAAIETGSKSLGPEIQGRCDLRPTRFAAAGRPIAARPSVREGSQAFASHRVDGLRFKGCLDKRER